MRQLTWQRSFTGPSNPSLALHVVAGGCSCTQVLRGSAGACILVARVEGWACDPEQKSQGSRPLGMSVPVLSGTIWKFSMRHTSFEFYREM